MVSGRKYLEPDRNCHSSASRISGSQLSTHAATRPRNVVISSANPSAAMTSLLAWSMLAASLILSHDADDDAAALDDPDDNGATLSLGRPPARSSRYLPPPLRAD